MTGQRVLVVDDDRTVSDVVRRYLERAGYQVTQAGDGAAALAAVARDQPDLVVLDLMLPGVDGVEVCRRLRVHPDGVPIVMLTALGEEADRVLGLRVGADDYVTKPFSPRELVLRVQSVLRRHGARPAGPGPEGSGLEGSGLEGSGLEGSGLEGSGLEGSGEQGLRAGQEQPLTLTDGPLRVDVGRRVARLGGAELTLTIREFDLLVFLMRHPSRAFRRAELLDRVWGWSFGDQSTVTVHVRRLREKVEADPAQPTRIVTVWGVGYRYEYAGA